MTSLEQSAERAGVDAARRAIASGDCRLMSIREHFISIPGAPPGEVERLNTVENGLKVYSGAHHFDPRNEADERINRISTHFATAYNGHVVAHREEADCRAPQPKTP